MIEMGVVVAERYLTGIVVGVVLAQSLRISLVSEPSRTRERAQGTTVYRCRFVGSARLEGVLPDEGGGSP